MNTNDKSPAFSVLIPDGESPLALAVLRCLADTKNSRIFVLSNDNFAPIRFSRYATKFLSYTNQNDSDSVRLDAILDVISSLKPDIILPIDVKTIRLLSENKSLFESERITTALIPETKSFDISNDKWKLAKWLNEKGFPHPSTVLVENIDKQAEEVSLLTFPVLAKPRRGSGGLGIKYFVNSSDLLNSKDIFQNNEYIIQSYIEGYDIDCSVLCRDGVILAHTIQKGYLFESQGVSWPAGLEFLNNEQVFSLVKNIVSEFNWSGIIHIDLRYDSKEDVVKIIEMNPRFWLTVMASLFAGVNFPYLSCLAGLNRNVPSIIPKSKRVVRTKTAAKLLTKQLFQNKKNDLLFDNSFIELIIKDPIPNIYIKYLSLNKKKN